MALAFPHQLQADTHAAVLLAADRESGLVVHADPFAGVDHLDGQSLAAKMVLQRGPDAFLGADQVDANGKLAAGRNSASELRLRALV